MLALLVPLILWAPPCGGRDAVELVLDDVFPASSRANVLKQLTVSPGLAELRLCERPTASGERRAVVIEHAEGRTFHLELSRGNDVVAWRFLSLENTEDSAFALTLAIAVDELIRANAFPPPAPELAAPHRPTTVLAPVRVDPAALEPTGPRTGLDAVWLGIGDDLHETSSRLNQRWSLLGPLELTVGARVGAIFGESPSGELMGSSVGGALGVRLSFDDLLGRFGLELRAAVNATALVMRGRAGDDPFLRGRTDTGWGLDAEGGLALPVRVGRVWIGPFVLARFPLAGWEIEGAVSRVTLFDGSLGTGLQLAWW